jgi:hypothetical protein
MLLCELAPLLALLFRRTVEGEGARRAVVANRGEEEFVVPEHRKQGIARYPEIRSGIAQVVAGRLVLLHPAQY